MFIGYNGSPLNQASRSGHGCLVFLEFLFFSSGFKGKAKQHQNPFVGRKDIPMDSALRFLSLCLVPLQGNLYRFPGSP